MASVQQHGRKWLVKWRTQGGRNGEARYQSLTTKREAEAAARRVEAEGNSADVGVS